MTSATPEAENFLLEILDGSFSVIRLVKPHESSAKKGSGEFSPKQETRITNSKKKMNKRYNARRDLREQLY